MARYQAERAAAEKARLAAKAIADEQKGLQAIEDARLKAIADEEARILAEQQAAAAEQLRLEREAVNAQTDGQKKAAQEAAAAARAKHQQRQLQIQQLANEEAELRRERRREAQKAANAEAAALEAERIQREEEAETKRLRAVQEAQKKETEAETARQEAATAKKQAELAAKKKRDIAAAEEAARKRAAAAKAAQDARDKAFRDEVEARKRKDARLQAEMKKRMAEKKAKFEAEFKHVWGSTATGLSIATIDLANEAAANTLISKLMEKTLIADVHSYSSVQRIWKSDLHNVNARSNTQRATVQRVVAITTDDRVAELIEETVDVTKNENADILIRQMTAASKEYNKWASLQTEAQDDSMAYYKKDAFENSRPVSEERVAKITDYQGGHGGNPTKN